MALVVSERSWKEFSTASWSVVRPWLWAEFRVLSWCVRSAANWSEASAPSCWLSKAP